MASPVAVRPLITVVPDDVTDADAKLVPSGRLVLNGPPGMSAKK